MSNVFIVWFILMLGLVLLIVIAYWFGRARQIQIFNKSQIEIIRKLEKDVEETEKHIARLQSL